MLIKQIKLENIRSYTNQIIDFPEGSLLLSGDIGAGKSTILLAIEFALFGIMGKKYLSGSSLLRNGKNKASVELKFTIDNKEIIIKRNLKRKKDAVAQDSGYIIINGLKTNATAIELKTKIIELLGYPKELIQKTKNLIYRFTVYTPQEEMKRILSEDKEQRLDTLRKVFGIDRYKRINENAEIIIKEIKSKIKEMSGFAIDLSEKQKNKKIKEDEIQKINLKIEEIAPEINNLNNAIQEQKNKIKSVEEDVKLFNEAEKKRFGLETDLNNRVEQRKRNSEKINQLENEIGLIKKEIKNVEDTDIEKQIKNKENEIILMRDTVNSVNNKISEINALIKNHIDIQKKIDSLDKCPTCHQEVSAHYKENIRKEKNLKINELNEKENMHKKGLKEADKKLKELEKEIEILRKKETEIKINKIRIKSLKEKENELNLLNTEQEQIKKKVGLINIEKMSVNKQIEELKHSNDEFARERKAIDNLNEKKNVLEKEKAVHETEKTQIFGVLNDLKKEIDKKIEIKNKINKNLQMQNWLEEFFVKLVSEIEKTIMANIYLQFNDLFEQWFNILIEDDTLNIRLDESFSPVVEQNDYEASIEHLSGGERTAAALAYRLALNRVINNMMSAIKTRDLIILDEPTDGFSSEQLDRVRDVLEQINAKQMIIVSHETKIESFVENTIRINKNEHVSRVV